MNDDYIQAMQDLSIENQMSEKANFRVACFSIDPSDLPVVEVHVSFFFSLYFDCR